MGKEQGNDFPTISITFLSDEILCLKKQQWMVT